MGEFFRGWRRKFGVMAMVMACVFMAAWIRSFTVVDMFEFQRQDSFQSLRSSNGWLGWHNDIALFPRARWESMTLDHYQALWIVETGLVSIETQTARQLDSSVSDPILIAYALPHLSIVLPLTALSAYLLLSKPRPQKRATTIEPPTQPPPSSHA
jgi:hypothetical protein